MNYTAVFKAFGYDFEPVETLHATSLLQVGIQEDVTCNVSALLFLIYSFRKNLSISFATFLPEAIALTTRLAPLTESPAANTF